MDNPAIKTVRLTNCLGVKQARDIQIEEAKLNVKLGLNGSGKSTIAKALSTNADNAEDLASFEYLQKKTDDLKPKVESPFQKATVFNQDYVDQHLFKQSTLVEGGFELVLQTPEQKALEAEMKTLLVALASEAHQPAVMEIAEKLDAVSVCVKAPTKDGSISKASACYKSLGSGNALESAQALTPDFSPYFGEDIQQSVEWAQWHVSQGIADGICPYCGIKLDGDRLELVEKLNDILQSGDSKKLKQTLSSLHELSPLLRSDYIEAINAACSSTEGFGDSKGEKLAKLSDRCTILHGKLIGLANCQELVRASCAMNDAVGERFKARFITEEDCDFLNNKAQKMLQPTLKACSELHEKLDEVNRLGEKLRRMYEHIVSVHEREINRFLRNINCPYAIRISRESGSALTLYPMLDGSLAHQSVGDPSSALSQGEKNVVSLLLFMYTATRSNENYDLIILDDPISSFDAGKRSAILRTLFSDPANGSAGVNENFFGRTVLMLTHDFPFLMETVLLAKDLGKPKAHYVWKDANGSLQERRIQFVRDFSQKRGLMYFEALQLSKARNEKKDIVLRLAALRRLLEVQGCAHVTNPEGEASDCFLAFEVISNVFHKSDIPMLRKKNESERMFDGFPNRDANSEFDRALSAIEQLLQFDSNEKLSYQELLNRASKENLKTIYDDCTNDFERLQICRIALEGTEAVLREPIMAGFLDESVHVSGDYLYQLDPDEYNVVSPHAIAWCNKEMAKL